jgi:hypothetical protein
MIREMRIAKDEHIASFDNEIKKQRSHDIRNADHAWLKMNSRTHAAGNTKQSRPGWLLPNF